MATPSSTPYTTGFGSLGSQVRAPMPAGSYSGLDNNAGPGAGGSSAPASPRPAAYASPKARLEAAKLEMTPEEREVIESIQLTSFRAQMLGLGVGAGLGYALTKRKFPGASWLQLAAPMLAGACMSPLWSMPLAYFLSKPQMRKLEGDEHLKSIITQSNQRNVPLNSVPVNPNAATASASASAEPARESLDSPDFGSSYASGPYASPGSFERSTPAAAAGSEPEDAWARLRRQAAPQSSGSGAATSSGSAWDNLRKGQTSPSAHRSAYADIRDENGDYAPAANAWGDAPTASMSADEREFAVDLERERKGQDGVGSTW